MAIYSHINHKICQIAIRRPEQFLGSLLVQTVAIEQPHWISTHWISSSHATLKKHISWISPVVSMPARPIYTIYMHICRPQHLTLSKKQTHHLLKSSNVLTHTFFSNTRAWSRQSRSRGGRGGVTDVSALGINNGLLGSLLGQTVAIEQPCCSQFQLC